MKRLQVAILLSAIYLAMYISCVAIQANVKVLMAIGLGLPAVLAFLVYSILTDKHGTDKTFDDYYYQQ